eukprot:3488784-Pyramimonas_sp.AAC.1
MSSVVSLSNPFVTVSFVLSRSHHDSLLTPVSQKADSLAFYSVSFRANFAPRTCVRIVHRYAAGTFCPVGGFVEIAALLSHLASIG